MCMEDKMEYIYFLRMQYINHKCGKLLSWIYIMEKMTWDETLSI
jgi:predicted DNA-binding transcriptional regulator AlpA